MKNKEKSPKIFANASQLLMAFSLLFASCGPFDGKTNADDINLKTPVATYNTDLEIPKPPSSETDPKLRPEVTETPDRNLEEIPEAYAADDPFNPDINHDSRGK